MNKRIWLIPIFLICLPFLFACRKANNKNIVLSEEPISEAVYVEVESASESKEVAETNTKYEPLYEFVSANISLMGTIILPSVEFDVTGDGHDDYCSTVITGSGIVSSLIAVYDVQNQKGYLLNERQTYDYALEGIEEGALVVKRREWGKEKEIRGHLLFEEDALIFAEITE